MTVMVNYISGLVFVVLFLVGAAITLAIGNSVSVPHRVPFRAWRGCFSTSWPRRRSGWPPSGRRPSSSAWASSTRSRAPGCS